jgi:hypothetical protein
MCLWKKNVPNVNLKKSNKYTNHFRIPTVESLLAQNLGRTLDQNPKTSVGVERQGSHPKLL